MQVLTTAPPPSLQVNALTAELEAEKRRAVSLIAL